MQSQIKALGGRVVSIPGRDLRFLEPQDLFCEAYQLECFNPWKGFEVFGTLVPLTAIHFTGWCFNPWKGFEVFGT